MMEKILFVNACARPNSRTLELAKCVLEKLEGTVEQADLYRMELRPLDEAALAVREAGDLSDPIFLPAKQFAAADTVVIAAPYWDLMFPAVLKIYFETVTVSGITFRYSEKGIPEGLCRAKKLIYVTTAGGFMSHAPFGFAYTEALARGFYGIGDVRCVSAEGLDIVGNDPEGILAEAKKKVTGEL